jgi:hypothetical protein
VLVGDVTKEDDVKKAYTGKPYRLEAKYQS